MPEISRFLGIVIAIFPRDHPPPHFHAVYGEARLPSISRPAPSTATFPSGPSDTCSNGSTFIETNFSRTGIWFGAAVRPTELRHWSNEMIPRIADAHYVEDFIIHLRFADGAEGDVDLCDELYGEIFEPLKDRAFFQRFFIHPEFRTLAWPNGADIAPEFLV